MIKKLSEKDAIAVIKLITKDIVALNEQLVENGSYMTAQEYDDIAANRDALDVERKTWEAYRYKTRKCDKQ